MIVPRKLTYCAAINEALAQEMARDPSVMLFGVGLPTHAKMFGSVAGLLERFGPNRVFDTPISEDAMTGFALGAALAGLRPIHCHIRVDFLLLAMNQLVNMVAPYLYSTGGRGQCPLVIRAIVGRGWGQGWQHSKSLHSMFAHIPGLKVVLPTTPLDAKGLLTSAIRDGGPVVVIEHRWLYWAEEDVPEEQYSIPFGSARVLREGNDLTIVATSWMAVEALRAADILARVGIFADVIDPRTIQPLDESAIAASVNKTRRCIVADGDWPHCGFGAEVAARVYERCFGRLRTPVMRIGFAPSPCPTVRNLENEFYPNAATIVRAVESLLVITEPMDLSGEDFYSHERKFRGPF